jgi:hypothetical protein
MGAAGVGITALATGLVMSIIEGLEMAHVRMPSWPEATFGSLGVLSMWCIACWTIATPLLIAFCRRRLDRGSAWEQVVRTIAARLFLGTIIEVAAVMPLDVLVRKKQSCYCWAGTFFALTICGSIGILLLGPLVLLPALARRRKRWYGGHCDCCGYDLTGLLPRAATLDRCPECGAGWKPQPGEQDATSTGPLRHVDAATVQQPAK